MTGINAWVGANLGVLVLVLGTLALIALVLSGWLAVRLMRLRRHYDVLTRGADGGNLQAVLETHAEAMRAALRQVTDLEERTRDLERAGRAHFQRIGFLRFNPFRDAGGDQSFALVLTDHAGNGVVLSSLHARDGARIYGKPLAGWLSPYPLTDEERQVIEKAKMPA